MGTRYLNTKIINNDIEFYEFLRKKRGNIKNIKHYATNILKQPSVSERASLSTTSHIWKFGDRYYNLSHKYYNSTQYWWVIAWYNGYPTEADIKPGDVIDIPIDLEKVLTILEAY
jgi:nucleoid-associated protein YgaU